jgi:hypothetical protein
MLWSLTLNIGDVWMLVAVCLSAAQIVSHTRSVKHPGRYLPPWRN